MKPLFIRKLKWKFFPCILSQNYSLVNKCSNLPLNQRKYAEEFVANGWNSAILFAILNGCHPTKVIYVFRLWLKAPAFSLTWNVPFKTCSIRLSCSSKCLKFFKKWKDVSLIDFNWLLLRSNSCNDVKCLIDSDGSDEPVSPCDIFNESSECPIC